MSDIEENRSFLSGHRTMTTSNNTGTSTVTATATTTATGTSNNTGSLDRAYSTLLTSSASTAQNAPLFPSETHGSSNSISLYLSTSLPRELFFCIICYFFGLNVPPKVIKPIFGIHMRPIPYQVLPSTNEVILDMSLNQPLIDDVTINSSFLIQSSIYYPLILLFVITTIIAPRLSSSSSNYDRRLLIHDAHSSICALLTTIGMSEFITCLIKYYVGRLRPNFYQLCGFDTATLTCTKSMEFITEARQSFPSGHSSLSTSGMGILAYFLLGRVGIASATAAFSGAGGIHNKKTTSNNLLMRKVYVFLALSPLAYSTFCASSRLVDNWHHPSDVVAGICIGLFCSTVNYHLWYPSVISSKFAGIPLSYLSALNDLKDTVN